MRVHSIARCIVLLLLAGGVLAQDKPPPSHASAGAAARMRESAELLLDALPNPARIRLLRPFEDRDRVDWHYTPRSRNGVALKEMDARGREALHALLKQALSAAGHRKVVNIIELELVLREIETFGLMRDPERYHVTFYGVPQSVKAWGWRFEGHHLSLNFTLAGDRMAVDTPSFFGANPAKVPKGPKMGLRALAAEEDNARALLASLSETQRREMLFEARTYGDIVTGNADKVDPPAAAGLPASRMSEQQRAHLLILIEAYAKTFEPGLAAARMARVREGGIENVRFGWAGSLERGRQHYYRIQGPLFLIEYDASQNDGNHVHTVWRDFNGDFGRDLLREHYQGTRDKGGGHRH